MAHRSEEVMARFLGAENVERSEDQQLQLGVYVRSAQRLGASERDAST